MRKDFIFTSESVSEGHPDKVSDRISDAVVDHFISKDPYARVACETLTTTNKVVLSGEIRGPVQEDKEEIISKVRNCIKDIGYEQEGFHWQSADVQYLLHGQSADIAMGVDSSSDKDEGAGDQGIMFGYACTETPELMPAPIYYSHKILELMAEGRKNGSMKGLEPDSKSQVTLKYVDGKPNAVTSVVISTQHAEGLSPSDVKEIVNPALKNSIPEELLKDLDDKEYYVNPTGNFVIGGPDGDTGLTGRKIIVDTYGGAAPHGGGAFSGKDPTKVDRSAAYASRYLAKNIVAAGLSTQCTIQLSYAIGVAKPLSIYVNTQGTNTIDEAKIEAAIPEIMNLSPKGIREKLQLNKPIYEQTAAYGQFGRSHNSSTGAFSWEALDLVSDFKSLAELNLHFLVQREEQLSAITQKLAPTLASQQIIFVEGEMGSGKTTFTRHLIKKLSDINEVDFHFQGSPTYQRENHYHLKQVNLVHFDFYQVENNFNIDLEDYVMDHCLVIEWPLNSLKKRYHQEALFIKIEVEKTKRIIDIQSQNTKWLQQIR